MGLPVSCASGFYVWFSSIGLLFAAGVCKLIAVRKQPATLRWLLKRWWFWAATAFMLAALTAGYLIIPVDGSKAKYDKIHVGMEESEVKDLLGGVVLTDWRELEWTHEGHDPGRLLMTGTLSWMDDEGNTIRVTVRQNCVTTKSFTPTTLSLQELMKLRLKALRP
jgi:hypothetical protein